ncbi:phosphocholine cytidylyltransferase family protein [Pseudomonas sp. KNUC1026]|uniref:phosphocholine cytidylyltransferase family protein n=1 Tax=Pseudomonas sp. KNUC1026 TaxID=2893890 RepID=UPI001F1EC313|nr:phosphocholine cytidylyltransferase family protein [Pseudomonas sp. KNUC1026]UFH48263.1 phosphocholine cytidylyltransferase family protein [Pseudomonas sp. KNUC1026]
MQAIILAAGRGSRLGSLTAEQPKPLTVLAGKPLLEWQLAALAKAGIGPVHLVSGYCADALEPYGDSRLHNPQWANSNMVRSLLQADAQLASAPTLICYGDIVYRAGIIQSLSTCPAPIAITYDERWLTLWAERFEDPLSDAETFSQANGQLMSIGEKTTDPAQVQGQYMGLLKFTPQGWAQVQTVLSELNSEQIDKLDMTSLLRALLERGVPVEAVAISGGWVEVDNPSDIELYERLAKQGDWAHDWRHG